MHLQTVTISSSYAVVQPLQHWGLNLEADLCNSPCSLVLRLSLKITLFIVYTVNNSQAPVCFESPPRDVESSAGVCGGKRGERKTPNGRKRGQRGLKSKGSTVKIT